MTARRVVTLVCDKPGCREHYVGAGQSVQQVRAEARKLSGWSSVASAATGWERIDFCRWHS